MKWGKGNTPLVNKQVKEINLNKVIALGSCFSRNIYRWLQHNNVVEDNSVWDIFFNPFSILSEFKRVFGSVNWEEGIIIEHRGETKNYIDPWRTWICKKTIKQLLETNMELDKIAHKRLIETKTIIITYGLVEVWKKNAQIYLNNLPSRVIVENNKSKEYESIMATNDEVYSAICETIEIIKKNISNDVNVILTLSPVPLKFTFLDLSIREANNISKAKLLIAITDVCNKYENVNYFPSYEIVQGYSELCYEDVWQLDDRHITAYMVDLIAKNFINFCNFDVKNSDKLFSVPYLNKHGIVTGSLFTDKTYKLWT